MEDKETEQNLIIGEYGYCFLCRWPAHSIRVISQSPYTWICSRCHPHRLDEAWAIFKIIKKYCDEKVKVKPKPPKSL